MVRAYCAHCDRDVQVGPIEVTVVYGRGRPDGEYYLDCPGCDEVVRGVIRPETVMELATSGARLLDPERPLTEAEIDRFVAGLGDACEVEQELASFTW